MANQSEKHFNELAIGCIAFLIVAAVIASIVLGLIYLGMKLAFGVILTAGNLAGIAVLIVVVMLLFRKR